MIFERNCDEKTLFWSEFYRFWAKNEKSSSENPFRNLKSGSENPFQILKSGPENP